MSGLFSDCYDHVGDFVEGLAVASQRGEWFHIRPDGSPAYENTFDHAEPFKNGRALVNRGVSQYFIRYDGSRI